MFYAYSVNLHVKMATRTTKCFSPYTIHYTHSQFRHFYMYSGLKGWGMEKDRAIL